MSIIASGHGEFSERTQRKRIIQANNLNPNYTNDEIVASVLITGEINILPMSRHFIIENVICLVCCAL